MGDIKTITCYTAKQWREWLLKNHEKKEKVILVRYKKHTGKKNFNQREAMDEAICFGWIDTTLKRIDDEKYGATFVKRKKTSKWSDATFARAREMIKKRKMSKFGLKMFKEGLKKPTHDHHIPKNPEMPAELKIALRKNKKAKENFEKFALSYKKIYYRWILSGKRKETRMKRVKEVVGRAKEGKRFQD